MSYGGRVGRKKALTKDKLLEAIKKYRTDSPVELAKKLHVSRKTIGNYKQLLTQEEIDAVFQELSEKDLKPSQMSWKEFKKIPIIAEFERTHLVKLRNSPRHTHKMLRGIWRVCVFLKRHPDHLEVDECSELLERIRGGLIKIKVTRGIKIRSMGEANTKKAMRSFLQNMKRISGKYLKSQGIDASEKPVDPMRARARLTPEHRKRFMEVLEEKMKRNWEGKSGWSKYNIPFGDQPDLRKRMRVLPKAFYYWGNRKMAVLDARIEDMTWGEPISIQKLVDKGLHRKGRKIWIKRTTQELLKELRGLWEALGCPTEGKWFTFDSNAVPTLFKECYAEAKIPRQLWEGMPLHIWRHTACQDLLDATERNWELVAEILGWESIDTMKKHYGKASEETITRGLLKSMGMQVIEEKIEFKF